MIPPTFNGVPLFGAACKMRAGLINPRASQKNSYPGLNGLESLDQGFRGGRAVATGWHGGHLPAGLNAVQALVRSYYDGRSYLLVDQFGNGWPFTMLDTFETVGPVVQDLQTGWHWQQYQATFIHLFV